MSTTLKIEVYGSQQDLERMKFHRVYRDTAWGAQLPNDDDVALKHTLEIQIPFNQKPIYDEEHMLQIENDFPLTPFEEEAGCCVLCRGSGTTVGHDGHRVANRVMWMVERNGKPIEQFGPTKGVWVDCIHEVQKKTGGVKF